LEVQGHGVGIGSVLDYILSQSIAMVGAHAGTSK
jgi:hypothetical protein